MNAAEERALEVEGLQYVYTHGELTEIDETTIKLRLVPEPESLDDKKVNLVEASLWIEYTDEYPNVAPNHKLEDVRGLDKRLLAELNKVVEEAFNDSLGSAMVFNVADKVQEWLRKHNKPVTSMHDIMMGKGEEKEEEEELDGEDGDESDSGDSIDELGVFKGLADKPLCPATARLTDNTFEEWKTSFRQEMETAGLWKRVKTAGSCLTGKMFFQDLSKTQLGGDKDLLCENENLFLGDDDADFDELEDED